VKGVFEVFFGAVYGELDVGAEGGGKFGLGFGEKEGGGETGLDVLVGEKAAQSSARKQSEEGGVAAQREQRARAALLQHHPRAPRLQRSPHRCTNTRQHTHQTLLLAVSLLSHFSFLISHFSFLISHFSFLISHFSFLLLFSFSPRGIANLGASTAVVL
jgi:hypothetical protein